MLSKRIAILGAGGQLGSELLTTFRTSIHVPIAYTHRDIDIRDITKLGKILAIDHIDVVINTVAENRVDYSELHPRTALEINADAVGKLAEMCAARKLPLIHFSTDYVFNGFRPSKETDVPNPLNHYGRSKYIGEMLAQIHDPTVTIIRTSGLYTRGGSRGKNGSFIDRVLRQAEHGPVPVVTDQITSPTYAKDLAEYVKLHLEHFLALGGVYHAANSGACSWLEFAQRIFQIKGIPINVEPIPSTQLDAPAKRPMHSVLLNTKLAPMRPWWEALKDYLDNEYVARP